MQIDRSFTEGFELSLESDFFVPAENIGSDNKAEAELRAYAPKARRFSLPVLLPYFFLTASLFFFFIVTQAAVPMHALDIRELLSATNDARIHAGLAPLRLDQRLSAAASARASDMEQKQYFSHVSPEGVEPWYWLKRNDYSFVYAGENLAINYESADSILAAWLESPEHRNNLLNPVYRDIGIGVSEFSSGGVKYRMIVELYGTPTAVSLR